MAQKTLNAFVVIGGRVDNTFGRIGTALVSMGSTIDEVSQKLINFGKESVEVYRDYQDSMLDAQVALSTTYGRGSQELGSVMRTLDAQAKEWAASTIFHTDDVANAIAQAAHANWDLNMILDGIPAAMKLAQAGSMDLSEAVDFIIKSVNGAGLEFRDLNEWIDEWTYAANSSAGDVEEFGEAMLKMGNTMKFAGNKEELLTMLAILHDSGTTGAAAGTLLRNSMLRLIAPTKKASDALAQLGVTQDDIDEAMSEVDGDTEAAVKQLEELGFSVYDTNGNLKDFMTVFADLYNATKWMEDDEKYAIWSAIFPTKTITGGKALMEAATDSINGLYAALVGGDAAGYGEYAGETMMSGLTGSIELFNSKVERLKQITGEALSDDVTYWTDKLGGFVDSVAEMDNARFSGLVGGLEVIAGAGPGLLVAGSAFRLIGFALGTHAGRIALGALAIGALSKAISDYNEAKFEDKFGEMDLDIEPLKKKLTEIRDSFQESTNGIAEFKGALEKSVEAYKTASQELSSDLLTNMLTQKELTDKDFQNYVDLGEKMVGYVKQGLNDSADMSAEFWTALFKESGDAGEYAKNPVFQGIIGLLQEGLSENLLEVEDIGKKLRKAITDAFDNDGVIDEDEYENILEYFRQLNEIMAKAEAEAQSEAQYVKRKMLFDKGQTLSYDAMMGYIDEYVDPQRQEEIDFWRNNYKSQAYGLEFQYKKDYSEATTDAEREAVDARWNERLGEEGNASAGTITLDGLDARLERVITGVNTEYGEGILHMLESGLYANELADAAQLIDELAEGVATGTMTEQEASDAYNESDEYWSGDTNKVLKFTSQEIEALGGRDAIVSMIADLRTKGNIEQAETYSNLLRRLNFFEGRDWSASEFQVFAGNELPSFGPANMPVALEGSGESAAAARGVAESILEPPIQGSIEYDTSGAQTAWERIKSVFDNPITQIVNVASSIGGMFGGVKQAMADGGRSTEPAIFAEAGDPEWFIPERHDPNTARLIAAAAHASGFSLAELAAMNGARMFADGGVFGGSSVEDSAVLNWASLDYGGKEERSGSGTTFDVHYAPVIHAQNAEGVGRELAEDKKRLKKLLRELSEEEELYESVVRY